MIDTVLEIVQDCLSEMGSDTVNSIDDTTESQRVALLLKSVFLEMVDRRDWEQHKTLTALDSSGDNTKPNYLKLPEGVQDTYWVRYNTQKVTDTRTRWETLQYLYPDEFIKRVNDNNSSQDNIDTITDWSGTELLIRNDLAPRYWTTFDDDWVVTDSYDSAADSTLRSAKSQAYVMKEPTVELVNDFVLDLPIEAFSMLKTSLKERAFELIKQMDSRTISTEAERQRRRMSRRNSKLRGGIRYPDYGRCSSGRSRNPTFQQDRD